jgi:hypothetical protein
MMVMGHSKLLESVPNDHNLIRRSNPNSPSLLYLTSHTQHNINTVGILIEHPPIMNLNNLLLSLVSLFGILALATAQEDESPLRLLRGMKSLLVRHSETPKVTMMDWMSQKKEYADLMPQTVAVDKKRESAMLPMMYTGSGIELLQQSYQFSNPYPFLPEFNNPAADYAVLSIEAVENENVVSQDSAVQTTGSEDPQDEAVVTDAACPSAEEVDYKGANAEICARIRFFCEEGFEYFGREDCGCGCKPVAV